MEIKTVIMEDNGDGTTTYTMTFGDESQLVNIIPMPLTQMFAQMAEQTDWEEIVDEAGIEFIEVPQSVDG